jgi:hypothetical protein
MGGLGSGKSTVARALSAKLGILSYDVDRVVYGDGRGTATSPHSLAAFAGQLAAEERWIADCNHVRWVEPLLARADALVWLDVPRLVVARQLLKRELIHGDGWRHLPALRQYMRRWWAFHFDGRGARVDVDGLPLTRAALVEALSRFSAKVRRYSDGRQALDDFVPAPADATSAATLPMAQAAAAFVRAHDRARNLWLWYDASDPYRGVYLAIAAAGFWNDRLVAADLPSRTDVATGRRHPFPLGDRVAMLTSCEASLDAALRGLESHGIRARPIARQRIASGRESFDVVVVEPSPSPAAPMRPLAVDRMKPRHGAVMRRGGAVRVVTPPRRWHYAAELDLSSVLADGLADRVGYLRLTGTLERGPVGVGVLGRDESSFLSRRALALRGQPVDVYLPIARLGDASSVVVQSWSRRRRGTLVIDAMAVVGEVGP